MCGACGNASAQDWASPVLGSFAARTVVAAVVAAAGCGATQVRAIAGGWTVRRPTGATAVVGTLTDLLDTLAPDPAAEVPLHRVIGGEVRFPPRRRAVTLAHGEASPDRDAVRSEDEGWPDRVVQAGAARVVVASDHPEAVLDRLLRDPLRHHVQVTDLTSATLPGWSGTPRRLPSVPAEISRDRLPALTAVLGLRLRGCGPHARTRGRAPPSGSTR